MPSGVYERTAEHIRNMSLAQKGKTNVGRRNSPATEFKKGQHRSPATEYKKGHVPIYKKNPELAAKGKDHYNWQGGLTSKNKTIRRSIEYRLWRESVFARDNWTCQYCQERSGILHAHHIKRFADFPELRFAIDNGTTLCMECHALTRQKQIGGT